jgi:AcrR family transcriptional regulator
MQNERSLVDNFRAIFRNVQKVDDNGYASGLMGMQRVIHTRIRRGAKAAPQVKAADAAHTEAEEKQGRRTAIRDKARDIFMRYGYRKTTIEDIGRACGLGKAALYYYFSSKEEIFAEVACAESQQIIARVRVAVDAADDPKAKLAAMVRTRFKVIYDIIGEMIGKEAASELTDLRPLAAKVRQEFFEEEADILKQILEYGYRRGVFKKVSSPSVPLLMISAIRGIELHLTEVRNAPSLDEGLESMLDLFFEGICR